MKLFNSNKLGDHYQDDIFVGDIINGNIYRFELNKQRTELLLPINSSLSDRVVNSNENDDKKCLQEGLAVSLI